MIKPSEQKYIIQIIDHPDGSETIIFRHGTPFSVKRRITDRFLKEGRSSTLYSDNRLEAGVLSMEKLK